MSPNFDHLFVFDTTIDSREIQRIFKNKDTKLFPEIIEKSIYNKSIKDAKLKIIELGDKLMS